MGESPVLLRFALLAFSSVLIIVNPFSTAPLFAAMTEGDPPAKRHQTAWRAVVTAWVTLMVSLNLSKFVACKIWRRRGVFLLQCRAHRLQRRRHLRGLLMPMAPVSDLLQTAIN